MFPPVHPLRSRGFRGKDKQDDSGTKGNESRFVRCRFCGAINDTELRSHGDGWGGNTQITWNALDRTITF